ncbi:MAG: hypothetical protein ABI606_20225 [Rhodoferax sp.]
MLPRVSLRFKLEQSIDPSLKTDPAMRLRLRVMHPMDTGLVGGMSAL